MTRVDRAAAIRHALCDLVATRGFHGTSMSAIAAEAGVAVGTAYVQLRLQGGARLRHLPGHQKGAGAGGHRRSGQTGTPRERFANLWLATFEHLRAAPSRARFLTQLEESPYHDEAMRRLQEEGDPLVEIAARPDMMAVLVPLPPEVLHSLSLAHAVRLAASPGALSEDQIDLLIDASWRAITHGGPEDVETPRAAAYDSDPHE